MAASQPFFPFPCCGGLTRDEEAPGTYDICEICRWEDDPVQFNDPDYEGGANLLCLNQARERFRANPTISWKRKPPPKLAA